MRRRPLATVLALAALAVPAVAAGCGASDGVPAAPADTRADRADDPRPPLPRGWHRAVNRRAGFNLGLPPGWTARRHGATTLVRSADRALAASASADRTSPGAPLADYARATVSGLRGYADLRAGRATRLVDTPYPAVTIRAAGTFSATGVRQSILLVALSRPGDATFTLLFFRSASTPPRRYRHEIEGIVRSFRAQRPDFARAPGE